MNLQHVNVRMFVDGALAVDLEQFINVFHEWVAAQSMDEMMIDVADYRHVPNGPAVVMVGVEEDYSIDLAGNRPALRYNRKGLLDGTNEDRLGAALSAAARTCCRLEDAFDGLKFCRTEFELSINDRALAPNTDETWESVKPEIASFLSNAFGTEFSLERNTDDPRRVFTVAVRCAQPVDLTTFAATAS